MGARCTVGGGVRGPPPRARPRPRLAPRPVGSGMYSAELGPAHTASPGLQWALCDSAHLPNETTSLPVSRDYWEKVQPLAWPGCPASPGPCGTARPGPRTPGEGLWGSKPRPQSNRQAHRRKVSTAQSEEALAKNSFFSKMPSFSGLTQGKSKRLRVRCAPMASTP